MRRRSFKRRGRTGKRRSFARKKKAFARGSTKPMRVGFRLS